MKQTIRLNTFETNSSSYHSLTLDFINNRKEINLTGDIIINLDAVEMGDYQMTWQRTNEIQKIRTLINYLRYTITDQAEQLYESDEKTTEYYFQLPLKDKEKYQSRTTILKALKKTLFDKSGMNVEFRGEIEGDCFDVSDKDVLKTLSQANPNIKNFDDEVQLELAFSEIIYNPDIILTHRCESNEDDGYYEGEDNNWIVN